MDQPRKDDDFREVSKKILSGVEATFLKKFSFSTSIASDVESSSQGSKFSGSSDLKCGSSDPEASGSSNFKESEGEAHGDAENKKILCPEPKQVSQKCEESSKGAFASVDSDKIVSDTQTENNTNDLKKLNGSENADKSDETAKADTNSDKSDEKAKADTNSNNLSNDKRSSEELQAVIKKTMMQADKSDGKAKADTNSSNLSDDKGPSEVLQDVIKETMMQAISEYFLGIFNNHTGQNSCADNLISVSPETAVIILAVLIIVVVTTRRDHSHRSGKG